MPAPGGLLVGSFSDSFLVGTGLARNLGRQLSGTPSFHRNSDGGQPLEGRRLNRGPRKMRPQRNTSHFHHPRAMRRHSYCDFLPSAISAVPTASPLFTLEWQRDDFCECFTHWTGEVMFFANV